MSNASLPALEANPPVSDEQQDPMVLLENQMKFEIWENRDID
jgi:hypothetical protein